MDCMNSFLRDMHKEKAEEVMQRLNLHEAIQTILNSEKVQNMVNDGIAECMRKIKKSAAQAPERYKASAERNVNVFESQKDKFVSDFYENIKFMIGMDPHVFLAEHIEDDNLLKGCVLQLFDNKHLNKNIKKVIDSQINAVVHKFVMSSCMNEELKNGSSDMLFMFAVMNLSGSMMLPTSIGFA